jgi:hypothetical protein
LEKRDLRQNLHLQRTQKSPWEKWYTIIMAEIKNPNPSSFIRTGLFRDIGFFCHRT